MFTLTELNKLNNEKIDNFLKGIPYNYSADSRSNFKYNSYEIFYKYESLGKRIYNNEGVWCLLINPTLPKERHAKRLRTQLINRAQMIGFRIVEEE